MKFRSLNIKVSKPFIFIIIDLITCSNQNVCINLNGNRCTIALNSIFFRLLKIVLYFLKINCKRSQKINKFKRIL